MNDENILVEMKVGCVMKTFIIVKRANLPFGNRILDVADLALCRSQAEDLPDNTFKTKVKTRLLSKSMTNY